MTKKKDNFHTIKSILNEVLLSALQVFFMNFHTIKSILNNHQINQL